MRFRGEMRNLVKRRTISRNSIEAVEYYIVCWQGYSLIMEVWELGDDHVIYTRKT
jgi:hypothetical protein